MLGGWVLLRALLLSGTYTACPQRVLMGKGGITLPSEKGTNPLLGPHPHDLM